MNQTYVPPDFDAVVPAIPEGPIGAVTPAVAAPVAIAAAPAVLPFTGARGEQWGSSECGRWGSNRLLPVSYARALIKRSPFSSQTPTWRTAM